MARKLFGWKGGTLGRAAEEPLMGRGERVRKETGPAAPLPVLAPCKTSPVEPQSSHVFERSLVMLRASPTPTDDTPLHPGVNHCRSAAMALWPERESLSGGALAVLPHLPLQVYSVYKSAEPIRICVRVTGADILIEDRHCSRNRASRSLVGLTGQ